METVLRTWIAITILALMAAGCEAPSDHRLVDMAERQLASQAEQTRNITELQREVAKGSRELIEADAKSRQDIVTLHREVQQERAEFGKQRDSLEADRRELASQRQRDSLTAAAITTGGLLVCCVLPLVLCWYLLQRPNDPADDHQVVEVLLEDLVAQQPILLTRRDGPQAIENRHRESRKTLSDESTGPSE